MRLGCGGCLGTLLILAALAGGATVAMWAAARAVASPEPAPVQGTEEDGFRAQQKIFEIVRRASTARPRAQRVPQETVLAESEVNSFLSRHLGAVKGVPFDRVAVRLVGDGVVEIVAQVPVRRILGGERSVLADYLPEAWRKAIFVLQLRGPLRLETETSPGQPKSLRLQIDEAYVGRQRVPVAAVEWLLGADGRQLTRVRVPESVDAVRIEPGRAVIRTLG